jgi:signal transduction histidine kinase
MHSNPTERIVWDIRQPLGQASAQLSSRTSRIHAAWGKLLKRYGSCAEHQTVLTGLHLALRIRDARSANPKAYREDSEHQGIELARRGVPAECAVAAVGLFLESCLPYLMSDDPGTTLQRRALARWASVFQFFLLSGYARHEATEREKLEERVSAAERRIQDFSVELADAYEKERRRLAQDLHDEIGHDLIVLKLYTQVIALDLKKGDIAQVRRKLRESVSLIKHALKGVRHLTFNLGPAVWDKQGFVPAVRLYIRQFSSRTGIKARFDAIRLRVALPASYETALYKTLQGALSNVAAHADARRVTITIASRRDGVIMRIEDDGRGFNVRSKLRRLPQSYGLRAMRDRIELLGGTIHFRSRPPRPGARRPGTAIEFHLPLQGAETS